MRAPDGRDGPVLAFDTGGALGSVSVLGAAAARRPFLESDLEERVEILATISSAAPREAT